MRNFKLKLFTLISALILSCSCFLFAPQEGVEVKAASQKDVNQTASKNFTLNDNFAESNNNLTSKDLEYKLYIENSEETSNYYTISVGNFSVVSSSKTISKNSIYVKVSWGIEGTISTTIDVNNQYLQKAIDNKTLSIKLKSDFESHHTGYMSLSNNDNISKVDGSTSSDNISTESIKMSSYQSVASFYAKGSTAGPIDYFVLDIKNPTIILSTSDITAPTASLTADMKNLEWSNEASREITFNVVDNESGIQKVLVYDNDSNEITSTCVSIDESTKNATYSFTAEYGKSYYVKTWDNVNNVSNTMPLIGADELKLDRSNNTLSIDPIGTLHDGTLNVKFNYESDGKSAETLYYKVVNETDFYSSEIVNDTSYDGKVEDIHSLADGTTIPFGTIIKNPVDDSNYIICAMVVDAVGNKSNMPYQSFKYDSRRYVVDVKIDGGILVDGKIDGTEIKEDELGETLPHAWAGTLVSFEYTPNEGYEFYEIRRFDVEQNESGEYVRVGDGTVQSGDTISNGFRYTCGKNYSFEVKFRYVVKLSPSNTEFTYSVDDSGEGKPITIDFTLNDKFAEGCEGTNTEAIDKSIITFGYVLNGNAVDCIKDAGTYTVNWMILGDNRDYTGSGSFEVVVNKKVVLLEYSSVVGLVYNGQNQSIGVALCSDGLNDAEKEKLVPNTMYYLSSDTSALEPVELKNAGEYFAKVTLENPNYSIENDICNNIVIAKKVVDVTYDRLELDYTASVQDIEYALSESIGVNITYYIGETETEFKNSGEYSFKILPNDTQNYSLTNGTGVARINKVNAYFALTKTTYDYTGSVFGLDDIKFVIKNGEDESFVEVSVNGLYFDAFDESDNKVDIKAPDKRYKIVFATTDSLNYNLFNTTFEIEVVTTQIHITVTPKYEYTGRVIEFEYVVKNQNGEILNNVSGLSYTICFGGVEVGEIKAKGEYTYKFTTSDVKFILVGKEGSFEVEATKISVTMNTLNFVYNSSHNYALSYSAKSLGGIDLTDRVELVLASDLTNATTYAFDFKLKSEEDSGSIIIENVLGPDGNVIENRVITIAPMEVKYSIEKTYTYKLGSPIDLQLTRLTETDLASENVVLEIAEVINAGEHSGKIYSTDTNYVISVDGCEKVDGKTVFTIFVEKFKVYVWGASDENATYIYAYKGSAIVPEIKLSRVFDDYSIIDMSTGEVASIVSVGEYQLKLESNNSNFEIVGSASLRVTPRAVTIVVDTETLTQTYAKNVKSVSYKIYDGDKAINIDSKITYFSFGDDTKETVYPYLVGEYGFEIIVTDGNYEGRLESDEDTYLSIAKKTIDLSVTPNQFKVYGDQDSKIEFSLSGVCKGDHLSVSLSRAEGEDVGRYEIILDTTDFDNYSINYVTTYFQITQKRIVIIADAKTKTFGEEDPKLTYKIVLNNAFVTSLLGDDVLEGSLEREEGENAGEYEITLGTLGNSNYDIIFTSNYLEILKKDIEIFINDSTVVYGEECGISYTIDSEYADLISGELEREEGNDVGEYKITLGSVEVVDTNYNLVCKNEGTYKILKKQITVVALPQTKVYGEEETLEYLTIGLIGSDTLSGELEREAGEDVGAYQIGIGTLESDNYSINFVPSTMIITKAGLSIVIDNKTQVYGNKLLELTYSVVGLKNDDSLDVTLKKIGGSDAGVYEIYGQFNIPNNYYLENYTTGTYTIEKADIEISLSPKTVTYTGKPIEIIANNFEFPLRYSYTKFGEAVDEIRGVGSYKVKAIFDGNNNYNPSESVEVSVVVLAQEIHITLGKTEFVYDGEAKYPEYGYDKTLGLNEHQFEFDFGAGVVPTEEGAYPFTLKIKDGLNYTGSVTGEVVIKKAFVLENSDSVIECTEATFDDSAKGVELKQETRNEKFNNEKIVSVCTLKNSANVEANGYVYTIKVKASSDVESVKLYKVGLSGYTEVAIKIEDGYFVFNVDNFESEYIITTEVKKLSTIGYVVFAVCGVLVLGVALLVVRVVRQPRRKRLAGATEGATSEKKTKKTKAVKSSKTENSKKSSKSKKRSVIDDFHII